MRPHYCGRMRPTTVLSEEWSSYRLGKNRMWNIAVRGIAEMRGQANRTSPITTDFCGAAQDLPMSAYPG